MEGHGGNSRLYAVFITRHSGLGSLACWIADKNKELLNMAPDWLAQWKCFSF